LISNPDIPQIQLDDEIIITVPFKSNGKTVELKGRVVRFIEEGTGIEFF
jgi:hypothetical protein